MTFAELRAEQKVIDREQAAALRTRGKIYRMVGEAWRQIVEESEATGFDFAFWVEGQDDKGIHAPTSDWFHLACGTILTFAELLGITEGEVLDLAGIDPEFRA